jgi:MoaA/NifB/PqqE/SkfB family radical SAM enzyme
VGERFDEVYVSLDGASAATHDEIRGAAAFARVARGVRALRRTAPRMRIVARCTLNARNLHEVPRAVTQARRIGFDHVSFLPLDAFSSAFGGLPMARLRLVPTSEQVAAFEADVDRLERAGALADGFVLESPARLRALARHLRASGGTGAFERPPCDAPWWSSVVEADGRIRPCFFHDPVGHAREGLVQVRASDGYAEALARIRAPNETCTRCVCPKKRVVGLRGRLSAAMAEGSR